MDLTEGTGVRVNEWNACLVGGTSPAKTILDVGLSPNKVEERDRLGAGMQTQKQGLKYQGKAFWCFFPPLGSGERRKGFWR